jgi:hypothetical protein
MREYTMKKGVGCMKKLAFFTCLVFVFSILCFAQGKGDILYETDQIGAPDIKWTPPAESNAVESPTRTAPEQKKTDDKGVISGPIVNADGQPAGALSDIIIYCSGGHGWTADGSSGWYTQRPLTNGMGS